LAQLKKTGEIESYIIEFQRLVVLVRDISKRRLVVSFMDGLIELLKSWVKGFNLDTLAAIIKKARDMAPSTSSSKNNSHARPPIALKEKDN
jgi:hypothetical protein